MGEYYDEQTQSYRPLRRRYAQVPPPPMYEEQRRRGFSWGGFIIGGGIAALAAVVIIGYIRRNRTPAEPEGTLNPPVVGPGPVLPPPAVIEEPPLENPMIDPGEIGPGPYNPPVETNPPLEPLSPLPVLPTYDWIPMRAVPVKLFNPYGSYSQFGKTVFERPEIMKELGPVVSTCAMNVEWMSKLQSTLTITFVVPQDIGFAVGPLDGATVYFPLGDVDNRLVTLLGSATLVSTQYQTDAGEDYEIYRTLDWSPMLSYQSSADQLNALMPKPPSDAVILNTNLCLRMNIKNQQTGGRVSFVKSGRATMVYKLM